TRGANDGPYDPSAGPPSVWASAYSHTGALVQAGINLAANLLEPPPSPATGSAVAYYDFRPSVALSPPGPLVADWANQGLLMTGDLAGSGVFTQTFINAPFNYGLPSAVIPILGGMPTQYPITITRDAGFTGPITISFDALPSGVTAAISPDSTATNDT